MTVVREGIDLVVPHPEELFIGGSWQPPATGARFAVVNPSNENVLAELPDVAPADVDKAVAAARAAFDDGPWPDLPVAERIARLSRTGWRSPSSPTTALPPSGPRASIGAGTSSRPCSPT